MLCDETLYNTENKVYVMWWNTL